MCNLNSLPVLLYIEYSPSVEYSPSGEYSPSVEYSPSLEYSPSVPVELVVCGVDVSVNLKLYYISSNIVTAIAAEVDISESFLKSSKASVVLLLST